MPATRTRRPAAKKRKVTAKDDAAAAGDASGNVPQGDSASSLRDVCEKHDLRASLSHLASFVLEKLNGQRLIPPKGLDAEYAVVHQLLEQTVIAGEGNSMLLLGSRGCGKTAIVETALAKLKEWHREDFHVVRLNGFLHTDDRIALREIWHQLGREMEAEEDMTNQVTSYADTMASLLALLSHPEDLFGESSNPDQVTTAKSVIIILDEFDLFTSHARQTLLYNLFDIAQAKKAPLAVLGLTTNVEVTEYLEKRVKSRFSHRYVFCPRPRNFDTFSEVCKTALSVDNAELTKEGKLEHSSSARHLISNRKSSILLQSWNQYLETLFQTPDFVTHLKRIYFQTNSPTDFFASALFPISVLAHSLSSSKRPLSSVEFPTARAFTSTRSSYPDPPSLPLPPTSNSTSTTSLPLSLLLTATKVAATHDPGINGNPATSANSFTLSFSSVYEEYVRLLTSAKASASAYGATATAGRVWGREVAREAWEKLVEWGLIMAADGGGNSGGGSAGDLQMFRLEISFEEVIAELGEKGCGALGRWWRET